MRSETDWQTCLRFAALNYWPRSVAAAVLLMPLLSHPVTASELGAATDAGTAFEETASRRLVARSPKPAASATAIEKAKPSARALLGDGASEPGLSSTVIDDPPLQAGSTEISGPAAIAAGPDETALAAISPSRSESMILDAPTAEPIAVLSATGSMAPPTDVVEAAALGDVTLAQVSNVSELTDVEPTDWAYQALVSLVEDYGCIEGYPRNVFLGNQPITRYEFAAGVRACLDRLRSLIVTDALPESDVELVRRLSVEIERELSIEIGGVDSLEAEVAELRASQFATQTKLRGVVYAHVSGGFASGDILAEGGNPFFAARDAAGDPIVRTIEDDPEPVFGYYTWLNFDTSFTGSDRLTLQLTAGDGRAPANSFVSAGLFNTFGTPFTLQTGAPNPNDVIVRELSYGFPVGDSVSVEIGARINWYRFFDNNRYTFFLTGANSFNSSGGTQVNAVDRGAGIVATWDVTDWMDFRVGYLAENTEFLPGPRPSSDPDRGLFGGTNTLTAQLGLSPVDNFNFRFLYTRSNIETNARGQIGGAVSEPLYGFADDGVGGPLDNSPADTFLVNFDWTPIDWLGVFGRYSYGSTHLRADGDRIGDVKAQSFQIGLGFPDLLKEGALGTVSYVIPFDILDGREFMVSGGGDGGTQQELEFTYRYPLTSGIALVPSFYWIMNANNFSDNPDIFLLNLQTQLFF